MMPDELPQSDALYQPAADSIAELFNRDPLSLQKVDRMRLIEELRNDAARRAAALLAGEKPGRPLKSAEALPVSTSLRAEDLL